jgi:DNA polymerase I-like protein with 3'-5' exonuclease and polymerase domains
MQLPFDFAIPKVDWTPPKVSELPSWTDAKRICIDIESKDPDLRDRPGHKGMGPGNFRPGCHAVGIAFAIEDGPSYYLPMRHEGGDNLDPAQVLSYVRDQAKNFQGTIVGANLGYDLGFLEKDDVRFDYSRVTFRDIINNAVLIYELFDRYSLDAIAEREGIPGKDETILRAFASGYKVDPKREMYKLPGRAVAQYARRDVELPLQLLRRQERAIEEHGIQSICDLEAAVLPILVKMRGRGVRVNLDKVDKVSRWAYSQETECLAKVARLTGVTLHTTDVWKADALARALKAAGFDAPLTDGGKSGKQKPSLKKNFLEKCGEVGQAIKRAREYNKLRTTFCERTVRYAINGRIHPVFHQLRNTKEGSSEDGADEDTKGARFGRFSCEHYNLQQEPARDDEFGEMWRDIYEPEDGEVWVCSDWSQQEPRIAVHYAEILGLPGAHAFAEQYRKDPKTDCHQMLADVTGIPRKIVKNYFNGCIYGMGEAKLCRAIGHPTQLVNRHGKIIEVPGPTGKAIIDEFKGKVPWVSLLTREAAKRAEKIGHVWTVLGRKCNFPRDGQGNYDWTHKAFSRIGQGGAADQMKKTLVEADRAGIPVRAIVHDEFDFSTGSMAQVKQLAQLQRETVRFNVPMLVDSEIGPSWGRMKKLSDLEKSGELDNYLSACGVN